MSEVNERLEQVRPNEPGDSCYDPRPWRRDKGLAEMAIGCGDHALMNERYPPAYSGRRAREHFARSCAPPVAAASATRQSIFHSRDALPDCIYKLRRDSALSLGFKRGDLCAVCSCRCVAPLCGRGPTNHGACDLIALCLRGLSGDDVRVSTGATAWGQTRR